MADQDHETFDLARETLSGLLDGWAFGTVKSIKMVDASTPYYHGMVQLGRQRAWFQSSRIARRALKLGPLEVVASDVGNIPQVGEVMMGKLDDATRGNNDHERKSKVFHTWYSLEVGPIKKLKDVCFGGTHLHEIQLLGDMRRDANDDVWALCRLVIFSNIDAFVDAHKSGGGRLRLSSSVADFVHQTSILLCDDSVWSEFVKLAPDAKLPVYEDAYTTPPHSISYPTFGAYDPESPSYTPATPPLPESPPYMPNTPPPPPPSIPYPTFGGPVHPESPPYMPNTPPSHNTPYAQMYTRA